MAIDVKLHGVVLDPEGRPAVGVVVTCSNRHGYLSRVVTDSRGLFVLRECVSGYTMDMVFRRPERNYPELEVTDVDVNGDEHVFRMPRVEGAYIQGKVVGPAEQGIPRAAVVLDYRSHEYEGEDCVLADPSTGDFRLGPLQGGCYGLCVTAPGFPAVRLSGLMVGAGEEMDLGALKLERGGDFAVVVDGYLFSAPSVRCEIRRANGEFVEDLLVRKGVGSVVLKPGSYLLQCGSSREGWCFGSQPFAIVEGSETKLAVRAHRGVMVRIEVEIPEGYAALLERSDIQVVLREAGGAVMWWRCDYSRVSGVAPLNRALGPGCYTAEGICGNLHASVPLTVEEATPKRGSEGHPLPNVKLRLTAR